MEDVDLSPLGLSGSAATVLAHLGRAGERSVAQLAVETGIAGSVVSRAVRDLVGRGLAVASVSRPVRVGLAPGLGDAVREMAADVRDAATVRGSALEVLAAQLDTLAPRHDPSALRYWLVPLRADADRVEAAEVRAVREEFAACVPAGRRPRGVPRRLQPGRRVTWRAIVTQEWPAGMWVAPTVDLEVRRHPGPLPWLEVLDRGLVATQVVVGGCRRVAWCAEPGQVALAVAGFERFWEEAEPVAQSTRAAQPLERATATRQRR